MYAFEFITNNVIKEVVFHLKQQGAKLTQVQVICMYVEDKLEKNAQNAGEEVRPKRCGAHITKTEPQIMSPKYVYRASNCVKIKLLIALGSYVSISMHIEIDNQQKQHRSQCGL